MRQGWCIGLRLPVQLRANNHNLQITKLNNHCYVINNQNTHYDEKLKIDLSQPVDLYSNNKKVISEIGIVTMLH